jgi:hypothetical protein
LWRNAKGSGTEWFIVYNKFFSEAEESNWTKSAKQYFLMDLSDLWRVKGLILLFTPSHYQNLSQLTDASFSCTTCTPPNVILRWIAIQPRDTMIIPIDNIVGV